MTIKMKLIIGGVIAIVLLGVAVYIGNSWGDKALQNAKKLVEEAQAKVDQLNGQVTSLNGYWETKEQEYKGRIASLNAKINERQKEINGLKKKVEDLEKRRTEIVIPQSPDLMCPEFVKMGYKSCTRATRKNR